MMLYPVEVFLSYSLSGNSESMQAAFFKFRLPSRVSFAYYVWLLVFVFVFVRVSLTLTISCKLLVFVNSWCK